MSLPASTEGFGTREFVHLIVMAIRLYLRHKDTIDPDLDPTWVTAMTTLVNAVEALLALNPPGPE